MSNSKFRPEEAHPAPHPASHKRLTPIQAMAQCIRDHRLFALYIELGGAAIDAAIEYWRGVLRNAKPCMERELKSELEEWAKHEKNPEYRPRRVRPTISTSESMRAVRGMSKATEARNLLMRDALEAASYGMTAQEVFLKRALRAFEDCRRGITNMPMSCEPGDVAQVAAREAGAPKEGDSPSAEITGDSPLKASATPAQSAAA
ncbi:hypothetical protein PLCT2_01355 [Planctomycetaceae bacterium]|nr:hypothetical protein PLCT2_01355 [Planctomycetaceae bacterium]